MYTLTITILSCILTGCIFSFVLREVLPITFAAPLQSVLTELKPETWTLILIQIPLGPGLTPGTEPDPTEPDSETERGFSQNVSLSSASEILQKNKKITKPHRF